MNEESYNRIRDCLEQLEAGPGCYGQVCRAYYTALCEKWDTVYPTDTLSVSDTHREDWDTFCDALKESGLHQDYRAFFDYFAPEIVQDWSGLCDLCDDVPSTILTVLAMLLDVPPLVPLEMPETEVEAKYLDYESLLTAFGMDLDAFRESWYCVHLSQLQDSKYFPKPAVQQAKQFYHENYLPMADLLSDYATLRLSNTEIEKKKTLAGGRRKNRTTIVAESGKSEADQQLENALQQLRYEQPTDVVRGLFYADKRNDAGFECSHVLRNFVEMICADSRVLVINPCPDLLLSWNRFRLETEQTCFVVQDETLARVYAMQFPCYSFRTQYSLVEEKSSWDRILLFARDLDSESLVELLEYASPDAKGLLLLPEVAVTEAHSKVTGVLVTHGLKRIIKIPNELTQSKPRKKILVYLDSQWHLPYFQLLHGYVYDNTLEWCIHKQYDTIPHGWLDGTMTVFDIHKAAGARVSTGEKLRQDAKVFQFSGEIRFHYYIQSEGELRVAGRVYYSAILRPTDKHRKQGKRLTPIVEKGLRQKNEAQLAAALETAVLDERIAPHAAADVLDFYRDRYDELSLKSVWYCLRSNLLTLGRYREETAVELFCGENQALSRLCIGAARGEDYETALQALLGDSLRKKHWDQLNIILGTAKKMEMISQNEVAVYLPVAHARLDKRQQEVRSALTKKTLESYEIRRMMDFLLEKVGREGQYRFITESKWLIPLIRLFSGLRIGEVCALRWMDFVPIGNFGTYQLLIRSYLDQKDCIQKIADRTDERYRSVPVAPALAEMLLAYKHALLCSGQKADLLELRPIITQTPVGEKPCRQKTGTAVCAELVEKAKLPGVTMRLPDGDEGRVTDLGRYGGDIYYSNIKFYLRHLCGFTEGELRYFLGLTAIDTLSAHYCDYATAILQHKMAVKLSRWTALYSLTPLTAATGYCRDMLETCWEHSFPGSAEAPVSAWLHIVPHSGIFPEGMTIEVDSRFGTDITIICFMEDIND